MKSFLTWSSKRDLSDGLRKLSKIGLVYNTLLSLLTWPGVEFLVGWGGFQTKLWLGLTLDCVEFRLVFGFDKSLSDVVE